METLRHWQVTENHPEGSLLRNLYFPSRVSITTTKSSRVGSQPRHRQLQAFLNMPQEQLKFSGFTSFLLTGVGGVGSEKRYLRDKNKTKQKARKKSGLRSRTSRIAWSVQ